MYIKVVLGIEWHHYGAVVILAATQCIPSLFSRNDMWKFHEYLAVGVTYQRCLWKSTCLRAFSQIRQRNLNFYYITKTFQFCD